MRAQPAALVPALIPVMLAMGCGGPVPGRELSLDGGTLEYSAAPDGYSGQDQFDWTVTSSEAFIRFDGTSLSAGSVLVTILDNAGQVILDQTLGTGSPRDGPTQKGQVGQWQVRLDYQDATGTLQMNGQGSSAN